MWQYIFTVASRLNSFQNKDKIRAKSRKYVQ